MRATSSKPTVSVISLVGFNSGSKCFGIVASSERMKKKTKGLRHKSSNALIVFFIRKPHSCELPTIIILWCKREHSLDSDYSSSTSSSAQLTSQDYL